MTELAELVRIAGQLHELRTTMRMTMGENYNRDKDYIHMDGSIAVDILGHMMKAEELIMRAVLDIEILNRK